MKGIAEGAHQVCALSTLVDALGSRRLCDRPSCHSMLAHPANPDEVGLSENLPVPGSRRDDIDDRPLKVSLTRFENLVKKAPDRTGDVIGALTRHCVTVRDCPMSLRPISLARKGNQRIHGLRLKTSDSPSTDLVPGGAESGPAADGLLGHPLISHRSFRFKTNPGMLSTSTREVMRWLRGGTGCISFSCASRPQRRFRCKVGP